MVLTVPGDDKVRARDCFKRRMRPIAESAAVDLEADASASGRRSFARILQSNRPQAGLWLAASQAPRLRRQDRVPKVGFSVEIERMKPYRIAVTMLIAAAVTCAGAEQLPRLYFGGGLGPHEEAGARGMEAALGSVRLPHLGDDRNEPGWKLFAGYRFNTYFGAELGYADLAEEPQRVFLSAPFPGLLGRDARLSGMSLLGTLGYPLASDGYVFGKFGGFLWDADRVGPAQGLWRGLGDEDGLDLNFGVGASYEPFEHFRIRAEWERYNDLGVEESDVDIFSGGIEYDF